MGRVSTCESQSNHFLSGWLLKMKKILLLTKLIQKVEVESLGVGANSGETRIYGLKDFSMCLVGFGGN